MEPTEGFAGVQDALALRLRELRRRRGLSQEALADRAGCHRTYIAMLEARRANPSLGLLWRVAEALGVQLRDLLCEPGP